MRGQDARYTIDLDFAEAAEGIRKRVTLPGGDALDLNVPSPSGRIPFSSGSATISPATAR